MARELDITRAHASYHLRLLLDAGMAKSSMLRDLGEGWTEFVSRTWLWVVVVVFGLLNAVWSGVIGVLGPLIATRVAVMGIPILMLEVAPATLGMPCSSSRR